MQIVSQLNIFTPNWLNFLSVKASFCLFLGVQYAVVSASVWRCSLAVSLFQQTDVSLIPAEDSSVIRLSWFYLSLSWADRQFFRSTRHLTPLQRHTRSQRSWFTFISAHIIPNETARLHETSFLFTRHHLYFLFFNCFRKDKLFTIWPIHLGYEYWNFIVNELWMLFHVFKSCKWQFCFAELDKVETFLFNFFFCNIIKNISVFFLEFRISFYILVIIS